MLSSTQDLLYIVLSLSILWFTVFLCWLLYQAARVLKNANEIIENITGKLELIADAVEFMRGKVEKVTDHMGNIQKFISGTVGSYLVKMVSSKLEDRVAEKETVGKKAKKKK